MRRHWLLAVGTIWFGALWFIPLAASPAQVSNRLHSEPLVPIPLAVELDADTVALGEKLFHDGRLWQPLDNPREATP